MELARGLNGVISGEHGIGITKLEFLHDDEISPFVEYKQRIDPKAISTRAKLLPGADLRNAYLAIVRIARCRIADSGASDLGKIAGFGQGLPALRQVQAGMLDSRTARQLALQPAQQDSRCRPADRGLPLRRTDAPRRQPQAFRRVERRCRPLHCLPQSASIRAR